MNKQFKYKEYTFNISVKLNAAQNRVFNSEPQHEVIANDMGVSNFYLKKLCPSSELAETISLFEESAKKFVDEKTNPSYTEDEKILLSLGFSKA